MHGLGHGLLYSAGITGAEMDGDISLDWEYVPPRISESPLAY
jgi:hypothetical protein